MVYYNYKNMTVSLGPTMPEEPFVNLSTAESLKNIIDLESASSREPHNQENHVWINSEPLILEFDLQTSTTLSYLHFWNYHTEKFDVDNIELKFYDSDRQLVDTQSIQPRLGVNTLQRSEDIPLNLIGEVQYIEATISGTNGEVDFNNIGFSSGPLETEDDQSIYLNQENMDISLGASMDAEPFSNRTTQESLTNAINAASADATETHSQATHVWVSGGPLELDFDFRQEYDLKAFHFWNYHTEQFDVDLIEFTFFNGRGEIVGTLNFQPDHGTGVTQTSQDYELDFPDRVQYVNAVLTGTNGQVDFNNIGFTGNIGALDPGAVTTIRGTNQEDMLDGTAFNDKIIGGKGDDIIQAGSGNDRVIAGKGNDELFGGAGNDTLLGGAGDDTLQGSFGLDTLSGGRGVDIIFGEAGDDIIDGGRGNDTLSGGTGSDLFIFARNFGNDEITDFETGLDIIDLSNVRGIGDFSDLQNNHMSQSGDDVLIMDSRGSTLTISDVDLFELTSDNFIL